MSYSYEDSLLDVRSTLDDALQAVNATVEDCDDEAFADDLATVTETLEGLVEKLDGMMRELAFRSL